MPSKRPRCRRFGSMTLDFCFRHSRIMLERKCGDRLAVLVAAAYPGECHDRADIVAAARELRRFRGGVKRLALQTHGRFHGANLARRQRELGYPPVIGGKNAISPAPFIDVSGRT